MHRKVITVLEGEGLLEKYFVPILAKTGALVRIVSHSPHKALSLKTSGYPGQITIVPAGNYKTELLHKALKNSDVLLNLCDSGCSTFKRKMIKFNIEIPILIAKLAKELNIRTVIHLSALNVNNIYDSSYAHYKYESEKSIQNHFVNSIVIRPSIMFGIEDNFLYNFKKFIKNIPFFPITTKTLHKLQPIYAGDVAQVILKVIEQPQKYHHKIVALGGKEVFSLKKIISLVAEKVQQQIHFVHLPHILTCMISEICRMFSSPLITKEQIQLLQHNNLIKKEKNLIFVDSFHIKQYTLTDFIKNKL